ncbi:MAG: hypothetical protein KBC43_06550 [Bacteroidales bacterium]|nr:hypothetical protein [Bacteroidales bacterium]
MNIFAINPDKKNCLCKERDIFSVLKNDQVNNDEIHEDMTADEISEVVTKRLMENIRKQFEASKERYLASLKK